MLQSQVDLETAMTLMDCVSLFIILVLTALGGRVALHLLRPHPHPSPFTHTARLAVLVLLLAGEATLLLYLLAVVAGRAYVLLEFVLARVASLLCPLLFVHACIAYCQSQRRAHRAESEGSAGLATSSSSTRGRESLCADAFPSAVLERQESPGSVSFDESRGLGEETASKSVLNPKELSFCVTGSETKKVEVERHNGALPEDFLRSDERGHHGYCSGLLTENESPARRVRSSAIKARRRGGCVAGVMSFLRAYLWVVAIGVTFISILHPDVYPCFLPASLSSGLSPTTDHDGTRGERSPLSADQALPSQRAEDNQYISVAMNPESAGPSYIITSLADGRNSSGFVEVNFYKPISTGELERRITEHVNFFGLCVGNMFSQVFICCLYYLLLLLYLALGVLGSSRLTVRDVERDVVLENRTSNAAFSDLGNHKGDSTFAGGNSKVKVAMNLHVLVDNSSVFTSDFGKGSVRSFQNVESPCLVEEMWPSERLQVHSLTNWSARKRSADETTNSPQEDRSGPAETTNGCGQSAFDYSSVPLSIPHQTGQRSEQPAGSHTLVDARLMLPERAEVTARNGEGEPDVPLLGETERCFPEQFGLSSEQVDARPATHFDSTVIDKLSVKTSKSQKHGSSAGFGFGLPRRQQFVRRDPVRWAVRQESQDSAGNTEDCRACQQMAPYVVMAAIVLLVQHVLLLPVWSVTLWAKHGQVQVTSPATVVLPTYCAVCFVFWRILRENGR